MNPYETKRYLDEYLLFHYGQPRDVCPFPFAPADAFRFHQRIVDECLMPLGFRSATRALDVGCAVGRLTFELARLVDHVVGPDNSKRFVAAAEQMMNAHRMRLRIPEGSRT